MSGIHYRLNEKQEVVSYPAATEGNCIAYLVERDGQDVLCVMEGGAYHQYEISLVGVARLVEEGSTVLRKALTR